jgi:hypothetical protein
VYRYFPRLDNLLGMAFFGLILVAGERDSARVNFTDSVIRISSDSTQQFGDTARYTGNVFIAIVRV